MTRVQVQDVIDAAAQRPATLPSHFIYVVRDAVGDTYNTPFVQQNVGAALRGFAIEVNTPRENNMINSHPNDFALYEVATYDHRTGVISAYESPKLVAQAASLKQLPATIPA